MTLASLFRFRLAIYVVPFYPETEIMVNMLFICLICALLIVGFMRDGIDQEGEIKRGPSSPATREKQLEVVSDAAATALGDLSRRLPTVYNLTFTPVVFLVFRPLRPIFLSTPRRLNLFIFLPSS